MRKTHIAGSSLLLVVFAVAAGDTPAGPPEILPPPRPAEKFPLYGPPAYGKIVGGDVALFPRVKVKDHDEIAPGAVPLIISVRDPDMCRGRCRCCAPRCVYVQVYAPPCPLWRVKVSDRGEDVELDYGEYEIEIESKRGYVEVKYDD